ncbi:hypothetical protein BDN71DRAFT_1437314 [Pleurotus eryngii]|uniref:Uncharacterized protein n=1 Tax=Pleurotus eryngii TaxID=5323 RepID=A0A9P5ZG24_PLEER|nr:hypothetical protein BDN71DRAFT_1437314 [Pleurotus eryngii]
MTMVGLLLPQSLPGIAILKASASPATGTTEDDIDELHTDDGSPSSNHYPGKAQSNLRPQSASARISRRDLHSTKVKPRSSKHDGHDPKVSGRISKKDKKKRKRKEKKAILERLSRLKHAPTEGARHISHLSNATPQVSGEHPPTYDAPASHGPSRSPSAVRNDHDLPSTQKDPIPDVTDLFNIPMHDRLAVSDSFYLPTLDECEEEPAKPPTSPQALTKPELLHSVVSDLLQPHTSPSESPDAAVSVLNRVFMSLRSSLGVDPEILYTQWTATCSALTEPECGLAASPAAEATPPLNEWWPNKLELDRIVLSSPLPTFRGRASLLLASGIAAFHRPLIAEHHRVVKYCSIHSRLQSYAAFGTTDTHTNEGDPAQRDDVGGRADVQTYGFLCVLNTFAYYCIHIICLAAADDVENWCGRMLIAGRHFGHATIPRLQVKKIVTFPASHDDNIATPLTCPLPTDTVTHRTKGAIEWETTMTLEENVELRRATRMIYSDHDVMATGRNGVVLEQAIKTRDYSIPHGYPSLDQLVPQRAVMLDSNIRVYVPLGKKGRRQHCGGGRIAARTWSNAQHCIADTIAVYRTDDYGEYTKGGFGFSDTLVA